MRLFEPDDEHRPVRLLENRSPDFDRVVRPNGQEEAVEGGVMQLAQRQSVTDDRIALVLRILNDVRRVEQFLMPKVADGALHAIGIEHLLTKRLLMEPPADRRSHVLPSYLVAILRSPRQT